MGFFGGIEPSLEALEREREERYECSAVVWSGWKGEEEGRSRGHGAKGGMVDKEGGRKGGRGREE